jgi:hypothetical protein
MVEPFDPLGRQKLPGETLFQPIVNVRRGKVAYERRGLALCGLLSGCPWMG